MSRINDCQSQKLHTMISSFLELRDSNQHRDELSIQQMNARRNLYLTMLLIARMSELCFWDTDSFSRTRQRDIQSSVDLRVEWWATESKRDSCFDRWTSVSLIEIFRISCRCQNAWFHLRSESWKCEHQTIRHLYWLIEKHLFQSVQASLFVWRQQIAKKRCESESNRI
jgi:hypothetical protein